MKQLPEQTSNRGFIEGSSGLYLIERGIHSALSVCLGICEVVADRVGRFEKQLNLKLLNMGKRKDTTAKGVKPSKTLSSVKSGSVVKLSQTPKSKSKEIAKKAATVFDKDAEKSKAAHDNDSKKKKKKAKEPTPPPETSESEEGSDSETDESVAKGPKKGRAAPATNGKLTSKKADADTSSSSSSSSDDESDEESEPEKPVKPVAKKAASIAASLKTQTASTKGAPPVAAPKDVPMSSDDDDSSTGDDEGSESESESVSEDDEDEKAAPKQKQAPVAKAPAANGTAKKGVAPQVRLAFRSSF